MARVLLFIDQPVLKTAWFKEELDAREVMLRVNMGRLRIGQKLLPLERRPQYAINMPVEGIVSVSFCEPPVQLSERMYRALFGLLDGLPSWQTAYDLDISEGRLQNLYEEIRLRFQAGSLWQVKELALVYGMV